MTIEYFAYGSNMDEEVMQACCPAHRFVGIARLDDYRLAFTRRSVRTGTGVADVVSDPGQMVWGVLYELDPEGLHALDRKEGNGWAYEHHRCRVHLLADGSEHDGITYTVLRKEPQEVPPSRAYRERLIAAARSRGLPEEYIATLTSAHAADATDTRTAQGASGEDQRLKRSFVYDSTFAVMRRGLPRPGG